MSAEANRQLVSSVFQALASGDGRPFGCDTALVERVLELPPR